MFMKIIFSLLCFYNLITIYHFKEARCVLFSFKDSNISGEIIFTQDSPREDVLISAKVYGAKSVHGFHIHEKAPLNGDCMSAAAHYNPLNMTHGGPADEIRHIGDLGNLRKENDKSVIIVKFNDKVITLFGNYSIVGRGCVVHAFEDDLGKDGKDSKNTGNAGPRLACGAVELSSSSSLIIFLFIFLFLAVFAGSFFIYYKKFSNQQQNTFNQLPTKSN